MVAVHQRKEEFKERLQAARNKLQEGNQLEACRLKLEALRHIEPIRFHLLKGCFINFYRFQR